VIHICINSKELQETFKDWLSVNRLLSKVFKKRANSSGDWIAKVGKTVKNWIYFSEETIS
jgi:hypothetical protein